MIQEATMEHILCPKCQGTKVQSAPQGIPPNQGWVSNTAGPYTCGLCFGVGTILRSVNP